MADRKTYAPHCDPESMRRRHLARDIQTLEWAESRRVGKRRPSIPEISRAPVRSAKNIKQRTR